MSRAWARTGAIPSAGPRPAGDGGPTTQVPRPCRLSIRPAAFVRVAIDIQGNQQSDDIDDPVKITYNAIVQ